MKKLDGEIIGAVFGDGSVCRHGYEIRISLGLQDKEYANYLVNLLNKSGMKTKTEIKQPTHEIWIRIWNKSVWEKFNKFFIPGKKKLKKIPREWKKFLRGVFDTDGSVHLERGKYTVISIRNSNYFVLREIQNKLSKIEIISKVYGPEITEFKGIVYKLRVRRYKNCKRWLNEIGSSNPRKLKVLSSCVKTTR